MKTTLQTIRILSDGRPGHENQSVGLAEALRRRTGASVECVRWPAGAGLFKRIGLARAGGEGGVDVLIGTGHGTHLPLLAAARKFGARSVVIMKPSLPRGLFDLCVVPRHDLAVPEDSGNVVVTRGALNRIPEDAAVKTDTGVILIGGPSRHHDWDGAPLPAAIREIVRARPELAWTVGDSRRTPAGFLDQLAGVGASLAPHERTDAGWLPKILGAAREVWVTEDSVSMVFEAVTAGARVGVLPMPRRNAKARTVKAVDDLVADGYARTFADWLAEPLRWGDTPRLHETGRCAELILKRFYWTTDWES